MSNPHIGYVGLNHHHCRPYLQTIAELPATVTCVCEPGDDSSVNPPDDVPLYHDYRTMFDREDVDITWVTLSNRETPDVVSAAIERDLDVFTEKPAGRTADDVEQLLVAAADASSDVCVSYPWRSHPVALDLRESAETGFFGQPLGFEARFVASQPEFRDTDHYLFDRRESRGGIVQWLGVHWLDLLPWLLRDPIERVNARTASHSSAIDVEDSATVTLETHSGACGTLQCGYYLREDRYDTHLAVYGDDGRFSWGPTGAEFGFDDDTSLVLESTTEEWHSAPRRTTVYEYGPDEGYGGAWGLEFARQFLAARNDEAPLPATLEDAYRVLCVLDAVYESADEGGWVEVNT